MENFLETEERHMDPHPKTADASDDDFVEVTQPTTNANSTNILQVSSFQPYTTEHNDGRGTNSDEEVSNIQLYTREQKVEGATCKEGTVEGATCKEITEQVGNLNMNSTVTWDSSFDESRLDNIDWSTDSDNKESLKETTEELEFSSKFQKDFEIVKVLGKGGFGVVFYARSNCDSNYYAVKRIVVSSEDKIQAQREVDMLSKCDHCWVVRYHTSWLETPPPGWQQREDKKWKEKLKGDESFPESESSTESSSDTDKNTNAMLKETYFFQDNKLLESESTEVKKTVKDKQFLYIQMQYCDETLRKILDSEKQLNMKKKLELFGQLLCAVEYIHRKEIMHRDIMPPNVLILDKRVKLGDFGLVKYKHDGRKSSDGHKSYLHTSKQGAEMYRAPELETNTYNEKVDIYSLGIILFELIYQMGTRSERIAVLTKLRRGEFPTGFEKEHGEMHCLIKKMMDPDPDKRPSAKSILREKPMVDFLTKDFLKKRHSLGTGVPERNQDGSSSSSDGDPETP